MSYEYKLEEIREKVPLQNQQQSGNPGLMEIPLSLRQEEKQI